MEPGATASVMVIEFRVADQAACRRDNFNFLISKLHNMVRTVTLS